MSWRARWHDTDTPRVEVIAVQLQEAKDLLARDTVTHARLAFILLDNAVEVVMFRDIKELLGWNPLYENVLKEWEEILRGTDDANVQAHYDEVKDQIVPNKLLRGSFPDKVDFLVAKGRLNSIEGGVVKKLHDYRTELYHHDHIRAATVHTASLLYFELACSIFERGKEPLIRPLREMASPAMERYRVPGDGGLMPSPATVVTHLRQDLDLDVARIKETLLTHLISRLDEMEADIAWLTETLPAYGPELVIRLAQLLPKSSEYTSEGDFLWNFINGDKLKYSARDLGMWRQNVENMRTLDDKLELFKEFADVENKLEPLEVFVHDLVAQIDHDIQREIDIRRGK